MAEIAELSKCYEVLREETLDGFGVDNPVWNQIVAARLMIERLGERDANYWWDSQVLDSFGRETLEETVPGTSTRAQISLVTKVGQKAEKEAIDSEDAVSLFDLGPSVESRIQRQVESIEEDTDLSVLEPLSTEVTEVGWTTSVADGDVDIGGNKQPAYEIGSVDMDDLQNDSILEDVVSQLIAGYGAATNQELVVPYYSVDS